MAYPKKPLADRFWPKVEQTPGCWFWRGAIKSNGYGHIGSDLDCTKQIQAHRASWEIHFGRVNDGKSVLHHCDIRSCVNPAHLFLGDHNANMADMRAKGRGVHGFRHWRAILTTADVAEIRRLVAAGESDRALGQRFGVSRGHIWQIRKGRRRSSS